MASVLKRVKMNYFVLKWKLVVSVLSSFISIKTLWRVTFSVRQHRVHLMRDPPYSTFVSYEVTPRCGTKGAFAEKILNSYLRENLLQTRLPIN